MTYGRVLDAAYEADIEDAVVSHLAEPVRGDFRLCTCEGPLISPSCRRRVFDTTGTFSPRGEGKDAAP